ncbi:MAG: hypothetical protein NTZ37_04225 [Methanoregula sp.]|nr:hypothetical protein [Methanoregula sp.]
MADFVQISQSKNAVRELATPIASVSAFNLIVQSVITDPFACVSYMSSGETHTPSPTSLLKISFPQRYS